MIFTDRTIIVKNGTSSIDSTIVLYRGDREVEIRFTLNEGSPFKFGSGTNSNIIEKTEATYGQLVIKSPGALPPIFSEVTPTIGGKIIFTITAEMIDETTEVGNYTFQIRLLDDNMESRATLPEVKNGIEIREPIALEDISSTNEVEVAAVGYALTTAGTQEDTFDAEGNYNKTTWVTGDRITAAKLNKIEAGIDGVNKKVASGGTGSGEVDLSGYVTKETGNASQITFADGQTFQAKLDAGTLKGEKGDKGDRGDTPDISPLTNRIEALKDVIIPSTWLDIPEAIRNFRNPDFTVEGGFDWFKISINLNAEGYGGIDFPLSEDIHNISFKATQYNFGFNLGVCFYKEGVMKKGYAAIGGDVSSEVYSKEVSLNIDWEYVKAQFLTGDYDDIRFIVWNGSNAIEGGYNILEDIKINGVSLSKDYEDRVKALETFKDNPIIPMDNVYRKENVYLNTSEDMSGLIPWGPEKYTIEGDVIVYSYVEETGNAGMESNPFISHTNFVTIEGEILDLNYIEGTTGTLGAHIKGKKLDGSTVYIPLFVINTEGRFKGTVDLNNLAVYKDLDLTQPITGLISNSGKVSAKIKDLKVYEDVFHDTELVGSDLVETCINFDRAITQLKLSNENQSNDASLVSPNGNKFRLQISDEGVISASPVIPRKTLFIGNSLLSGFYTFGMCASNNQEDYYAYVTQHILRENPQAEFTKKPASTFEEITNPSEVATWINSNIKTLSNDYNLVLIQLGDNVNTDEKNEVFKTSCRTLLSEVRRYMPNALVCWVGAWYTNATKQEIMSKSCLATGSKFIDISDLAVPEHKGHVGDLITYPDGTVQTVTSTGVASHPSSKGMKAIADRIISTIF